MKLPVQIKCDESFDALARLFEDLAEVPVELGERLFRLVNETDDRFRIQGDRGATPGTFVMGIRLAPEFADRLREFAAAVGARDFDLFFVEHEMNPSIGGCVASSTMDEGEAAVNAASPSGVSAEFLQKVQEEMLDAVLRAGRPKDRAAP